MTLKKEVSLLAKVDYIKKGQLLSIGLPHKVAELDYFKFRLEQYGDANVTMYYKTGKNKFVFL